MKRLTKRLLEEINHSAEELISRYHSESSRVYRLNGKNYIYFTNGMLMKVFLKDGDTILRSSSFVFPIFRYTSLKILRNILEDVQEAL